MKKQTLISLSTLAASLILLAGCSTATSKVNTANTNTTINTNASVNANANENTNTEVSSDVDTSDWLTYTNDEYGFSFKYPSSISNDKSYILTSNFNTTDTYTLAQLSQQTIYPGQVFSVNVTSNAVDTVIDQIIKSDGAGTKTQSITTLNDKSVHQININGVEGNNTLYIYTTNDKTILVSVPDNKDFNQVLSTFTFTK